LFIKRGSEKGMSESALWFLIKDQKLLLKSEGEKGVVPQSSDLRRLGLEPMNRQYLGSLDDRPCFAAEVADGTHISDPLFAFKDPRRIFEWLEEELIWIAALANQLVHWNRNHQYCGKCGHPTQDKEDERAKICPECGLVNYPRLSPAIIVAVVKENRILLAHSRRYPKGLYSVLAGFVEPGETLEECIQREVREEVGIDVKNIRYFGSQPWLFPDSFMIAFTAEYAGGDIAVDHSEILDAGWFSADNLPSIPTKISISRKLIDWFIEKNRE
jgi:NAD+ diphosphatase